MRTTNLVRLARAMLFVPAFMLVANAATAATPGTSTDQNSPAALPGTSSGAAGSTGGTNNTSSSFSVPYQQPCSPSAILSPGVPGPFSMGSSGGGSGATASRDSCASSAGQSTASQSTGMETCTVTNSGTDQAGLSCNTAGDTGTGAQAGGGSSAGTAGSGQGGTTTSTTTTQSGGGGGSSSCGSDASCGSSIFSNP
jgi:hypothetical protein